MRLFSRRHRGAQSAPVVGSSFAQPGFTPPDATPEQAERVFAALLAGKRPPGPLTARQSITASLSRDQDLAARPDHVMTLVDDILLDLADNRLEIVASDEIEIAPEVLGRARPDRPTGW